jgi:hypothetical protein
LTDFSMSETRSMTAPSFLNGLSSLILILKHYLEEQVIDLAANR